MAEIPPYTLRTLDWDTEFFGVSCAKAVLAEPLPDEAWVELLRGMSAYAFVSIDNRDSDPDNTRRIGTGTKAFLADVNVQFEKILTPDRVSLSRWIAPDSEPVPSIRICEAMERDERILGMSVFAKSKFITDPELRKRGGENLHREWLSNSFGKPDKFFAVARDESGAAIGYLLHSYSDRICTIELISVDGTVRHAGVGSKLYRAVEREAFRRGCDTIHVGTQIRNIEAVNFYYKSGFKLVGCHSIFHLWNL